MRKHHDALSDAKYSDIDVLFIVDSVWFISYFTLMGLRGLISRGKQAGFAVLVRRLLTVLSVWVGLDLSKEILGTVFALCLSLIIPILIYLVSRISRRISI